MGDAVSTVLAQATAWFESQGWSFEVLKAGAVIRLSINTSKRQWAVLAHAFEEEHLVVFLTIVARGVPASRQPAVLEWLNQLNNKLWLGNFQLEASDGVVLFRTSLDALRKPISADAFASACFQNLATAERFVGSLEKVIAGAAPEAVVEAALRRR